MQEVSIEKNIIAVCDTDAEYACNFSEYLNNRKKLPFQAEAFTNVDKLCDYAGKNPPEILLIAESEVNSRVEDLNAENLIMLSDDKEKEKDKYKSIYKYQSAESVIQEVMEYYTRNSSAVFYAMAERKISVIGVYSPVGRCGKTLFALTAGEILGEEKSVLYVNMESVSGFSQLFQEEYERNLADFFYELRCQEADSVKKLERMIKCKGKLHYIPPAESPEDVRGIQFSEWMKLFDMIRMGTNYQVLILDIGNCVDQLFRVLNLCGKIYVPVLDDSLSRCKLAQFKKLIKDWGMIEDERIREIHLPVFYPDFSNPDFTDSLSWGKWGACVRKALDKNG